MTNAEQLCKNTERLARALASGRCINCPARELCEAKAIETGASDCVKTLEEWLSQEVPTPTQKDPLCFTCEHGENGAVDDFATCYCPHHGYVGQRTECGDYERKEVQNEIQSAYALPLVRGYRA